MQYNNQIHKRIINEVANGLSLINVAKIQGMPSAATMISWIRLHPEFKEELDMARALHGGDILHQNATLAASVDNIEKSASSTPSQKRQAISRIRLQITANHRLARHLIRPLYGAKNSNNKLNNKGENQLPLSIVI